MQTRSKINFFEKTLCHDTGDSKLHNVCKFQNKHINRILKLQDKAIRVINFAQYNESRSPLHKNSKVLKFNDNIALNELYVCI